MADEQKGILARLMTETWPARAGRGILDALMLPGQVAGGILNVQPERPGYWSDTDEARSQLTNQTMMNRAADLGGLMMLGAYGQAPAGAIGMSGAQRYAFNDPIHKEIALRDAQRYGGQGGGKVYETQAAVDRATGYVPPQAGSYQESIRDILLRDRSNRGDLMQQYRDAMYPARNRGETMDEAADALWRYR